MIPTYDAIVLGTGGVGSAAMYHLARLGARVLGIDQFSVAHDQGSSHGRSRVIRLSYFEHPDYVPLLLRAYELWEELEALSGQQLYREVGLLQIGPSDGIVIPGVRRSAKQHGLQLETISSTQLQSRFPGFVVPDFMEAIFEKRAGILAVEQCVRSHVRLAIEHGAEHRTGELVVNWKGEAKQVLVKTNKGEYIASSLVITPGAWASSQLDELRLPLKVLKKTMFWFQTSTGNYEPSLGSPAFLYELPEGIFYGFPKDDWGVKVAEHSGGQVVSDPDILSRNSEPNEFEPVRGFVQKHLPAVGKECTKQEVCMYTMSPDENFIVDRYPQTENVVFAAALSGHGFKFTSVLGEILASISMKESARKIPSFLSLERFG